MQSASFRDQDLFSFASDPDATREYSTPAWHRRPFPTPQPRAALHLSLIEPLEGRRLMDGNMSSYADAVCTESDGAVQEMPGDSDRASEEAEIQRAEEEAVSKLEAANQEAQSCGSGLTYLVGECLESAKEQARKTAREAVVSRRNAERQAAKKLLEAVAKESTPDAGVPEPDGGVQDASGDREWSPTAQGLQNDHGLIHEDPIGTLMTAGAAAPVVTGAKTATEFVVEEAGKAVVEKAIDHLTEPDTE